MARNNRYFAPVRDAVQGANIAAGTILGVDEHGRRIDLPAAERAVLSVCLIGFLGWGKSTDKIATPRIAYLAGWWDGEGEIPRHVRRRVTRALENLDELGLIGYRPARGRPGRDGQNLSTITLPNRDGKGTLLEGPISAEEKGTPAPDRKGTPAPDRKGTLLEAPHLGNRGNKSAYAPPPSAGGAATAPQKARLADALEVMVGSDPYGCVDTRALAAAVAAYVDLRPVIAFRETVNEREQPWAKVNDPPLDVDVDVDEYVRDCVAELAAVSLGVPTADSRKQDWSPEMYGLVAELERGEPTSPAARLANAILTMYDSTRRPPVSKRRAPMPTAPAEPGTEPVEAAKQRPTLGAIR